MGCFKSSCKGVIFLTNMVGLITGLAIMGFSGYMIYEQFANKIFLGSNADYYVFIPLAIGLIITLMACCANNAALKEKRCALLFFAMLYFVFGFSIVFGGYYMVILSQAATAVATTPAKELGGMTWAGIALDQWVSDIELGLYNQCCTIAKDYSVFQSCSSKAAGFQDACYYTLDTVASFKDLDTQECKMVVTNFCDSGNVTETYQQSDLEVFHANVEDYSKTTWLAFGIGFIVLGSFLLLSFIGSCYIACCSKPTASVRAGSSGGRPIGPGDV